MRTFILSQSSYIIYYIRTVVYTPVLSAMSINWDASSPAHSALLLAAS